MRVCSKNFVLVWLEKLIVVEQVLVASDLLPGEDSIEGLVHDRRTANPDLLDVLEAELSDLLPDEVLVPPLRVDLFLRETQEQVEVAHLVSLAVGVEGFEELEGNGLVAPGKRDIEV